MSIKKETRRFQRISSPRMGLLSNDWENVKRLSAISGYDFYVTLPIYIYIYIYI